MVTFILLLYSFLNIFNHRFNHLLDVLFDEGKIILHIFQIYLIFKLYVSNITFIRQTETVYKYQTHELNFIFDNASYFASIYLTWTF